MYLVDSEIWMIVSLSCATVTYIVSSVMKTPKRARKCEVLINIVKEYAVTSHKLYAKLTSGVHTLEGVVDGVQRGMRERGQDSHGPIEELNQTLFRRRDLQTARVSR